MKEKVRVLMPLEISCLNDDVDTNSIEKDLNNYVQALLSRINIQDLADWSLLILVNVRSSDVNGVFKRARRYPKAKEFEFSISITTPNDDQAPYGLFKVKESYYKPLNDMDFFLLEPLFGNYENLYEYILESSKRAIDLAFTRGITCNGKKIKFQN